MLTSFVSFAPCNVVRFVTTAILHVFVVGLALLVLRSPATIPHADNHQRLSHDIRQKVYGLITRLLRKD